MVFLVLAFISSALVSVLMRAGDLKAKNSMGMLAVNYIVCAFLAAMEARFQILPAQEGLGRAVAMGTLNGVFYLGGFLLLRHNIRRSGVVLSSTFMKSYRRHAIIVILLLAAIITPTTDVFTLLVVTLPMYILYEASILIVQHGEPKRRTDVDYE